MQKKLLETARASRADSPKGFAAALIDVEWIKNHLHSTPHLGVLHVLAPGKLSRMDYVLAQCSLLLDCKEQVPNLGLSSWSDSEEGLLVGTRRLTGLEIAQSWAILCSVGHLFGTIATERALLYQLDRSRELASDFLSQVPPQLREQIARVLRNKSMYRLAPCIAAWRLQNEPMPPEIRSACVRILELYFSDSTSQRIRRMKRIGGLVRRIAYLRIHGELGLGELGHQLLSDDVLQRMVAGVELAYEDHSHLARPEERALHAVDRYDYETFFTGPRAAHLVLTHISEFKAWWAANSLSGAKAICALFSRPPDWPDRIEISALTPVVRLELPLQEERWVNEVHSWLGDSQPGAEVWQTGNFLVSVAPGGNLLTVDVYEGGPSGLDEATLCHIATVLAGHSERSWRNERHPDNPRLWASVARFGLGLTKRWLLPTLLVRLYPAAASEGVGFAALGSSWPSTRERVLTFAERAQDAGRRQELRALVRHLDGFSSALHGPWLVFLGACKIIDTAREVEVQEIDGLAVNFDNGRITWHAIELKSGKQRGSSTKIRTLEARLSRCTQPKNGQRRRDGETIAWTAFSVVSDHASA